MIELNARSWYLPIAYGHSPMLWFTHTEEYKEWSKHQHPLQNSFTFVRMTEERQHATRLEF